MSTDPDKLTGGLWLAPAPPPNTAKPARQPLRPAWLSTKLLFAAMLTVIALFLLFAWMNGSVPGMANGDVSGIEQKPLTDGGTVGQEIAKLVVVPTAIIDIAGHKQDGAQTAGRLANGQIVRGVTVRGLVTDGFWFRLADGRGYVSMDALSDVADDGTSKPSSAPDAASAPLPTAVDADSGGTGAGARGRANAPPRAMTDASRANGRIAETSRDALPPPAARPQAARPPATINSRSQRDWDTLPTAAPPRTSSGRGPSFACARTGTDVERMICSDPGLAALDRQMVSLYNQVRSNRQQREQVLTDQRLFLAAVSQCEDRLCIRQMYQDRISELAGY